MQSLTFSLQPNEKLNILCLGAHCDDIEIGCGGTLLKLGEKYDNLRIKWVVFSSNKVRKNEAELSADYFLKSAHFKDVEILDFKDGYLPAAWSELKNRFENFKEFEPDLIFTHYRNDLHQDHRLVNKLTWNTFRDHFILEYEIPKYDGDMGNPNFFVPVAEEHITQKKDIILQCFKSQLGKQWFDDILLTSLLRIRGVECNSTTKFAEAFYSRKIVL